MERKEFIKTCGVVCLGGVAITSFLQGCASSTYIAKSTFSGSQIVIPKTEFIQTRNDKIVQRGFVLVKSEKFNFPICIYKSVEGKYTALLMECTHKGCELQPHGSFLICPCHGSEFDNKGIVQNPPAEENLKTFNLTTDHENIYIEL